MSHRLFGFYFMSEADRCAFDRTVYVGVAHNGNAVLEARYKDVEHNSLYTIEMDADDLEVFGNLCISLAQQMRARKILP